MEVLINTALSAVWPAICEPRQLRTPDEKVGKSFSVVGSDQSSAHIVTEGGSPIQIQREAFLAALRYLAEHQHNQDNPCEIRSNQLAEKAGPLCQVTRTVNSGTRVINYIAPMLATAGLVTLRGRGLNAVWLA